MESINHTKDKIIIASKIMSICSSILSVKDDAFDVDRINFMVYKIFEKIGQQYYVMRLVVSPDSILTIYVNIIGGAPKGFVLMTKIDLFHKDYVYTGEETYHFEDFDFTATVSSEVVEINECYS